jgi:hypothetical protein
LSYLAIISNAAKGSLVEFTIEKRPLTAPSSLRLNVTLVSSAALTIMAADEFMPNVIKPSILNVIASEIKIEIAFFTGFIPPLLF